MKRITIAWVSAVALAAAMLALPASSFSQVSVGIAVRIGPPALPIYPQPLCPGAGYLWTPGYWAYGVYGYYWVPGTWVLAPAVGMLWTPGYWGWRGDRYYWHGGYWGPHVGFYGGIDYGYGYMGTGYEGGYWRGRAFFYNHAVNNVNVTVVHNTYYRNVINAHVTRVSYNGGAGGLRARPTREQIAWARERHMSATPAQMHNEHMALHTPAQRFSFNHGRPGVVATTRAGVFRGRGVVRVNHANGGNHYPPIRYRAPQNRPALRMQPRRAQRRPPPRQKPRAPFNRNRGRGVVPVNHANGGNHYPPIRYRAPQNRPALRMQPRRAQRRPPPRQKPPAQRNRNRHPPRSGRSA